MFEGRPFTQADVGRHAGFVYVITNRSTGRKYVGRKYFTTTSRARRAGRIRRRRTVSAWENYFGSSEEFLKMVDEYGMGSFDREILSLHATRGDTNTAEVAEQFRRNVLEDSTYVNGNINGKWHRPPQWIIDARVRSKCPGS